MYIASNIYIQVYKYLYIYICRERKKNDTKFTLDENRLPRLERINFTDPSSYTLQKFVREETTTKRNEKKKKKKRFKNLKLLFCRSLCHFSLPERCDNHILQIPFKNVLLTKLENMEQILNRKFEIAHFYTFSPFLKSLIHTFVIHNRHIHSIYHTNDHSHFCLQS